MDTILPGIFTTALLVIASLIIGRSTFSSFQVLGDSWQDAQELSVELVRSDISISSIVISDSLAGTADETALFGATSDAVDYVQSSDGQVTIFIVNQDDSDWLRVDDINVTITTDVGSTVYDFTGITSPSSSDTAEDGQITVTDTVIADGTFGARRDTIAGWSNWDEATTGEYGDLVGSDDSYYQGADPGDGNNAAMIFEFFVAETPADITQIDVQVEGAQGAATDAWFIYLWNYSTSTYAVCCDDVAIVVQNDGATRIVDFAQMDLVTQYTMGSGTVLNTYVDFTTESAPQPASSWLAVSVSNDVIDPGVLNTGESLNITAKLFPAVGTSTSNWLQVTTELGISGSLIFAK